MKTTKRKRSTKSAPVTEAALDSAPPVAASAEPAAVEVIAAEPANEALVAEAVPAEASAPVATEAVVAEVSEPVVTEAVVAEVSEAVAVEAAAEASEAVTEVTAEAVALESNEPVVDAPSAPVDATPVEPVLVLAANCSVKDAAALKSSLCALANESAAVTLDTSAVERVDTATMQLLCAFVRDRSARNQSVVWRGVSQALSDAVRLLGVAALLGLDETKGVAA